MKKEDIPDKGRTFPVDPNLPRCVCQNCHHALCIVGVDSYVEKFPNDSSRSAMQGSLIPGASSVLGSTRMDNSFVLLPKQKPLAQGIPPGPRGVPGQSDAAQPGKTMEESFVVVYKSESASDGGGTQLPLSEGGPNSPLQPNNSGFHSTITVLKRAFEIATTQTQVEQPLCLECMRVLSDKLDKEIEDASRDIEAYEACLQRLEGEPRDVLSEADFCKEKLKIEEEERKLEAAIKEIEKQNVEVNAELKELEQKSNRFKELQERYWQEFNNFQFQLIAHQEERDAILAKTEVSQAHLELLKRTNVLNDAFPIWHDGEFGTINNFRLGRLPKIPVEWDEINAAWGQACLLLHTMCQYFRPKFLYRIKIIPMGSYPRIMDSNNNTYDLIENDKVENYSITQSFNKQENWTKALKYTLCNLKWALYWFIGSTNFQPLSAMVSSATEVPAVGSLYAKRGPDPKILARKPSNS
ncbi:beclin-1-like protein isoform X2 [Durio zibethinus]|uniref:Beclin-1-like protein isoform X2 n=1 Tax=Durio zibethinus TaxID=66656 RepID=A0A6P6B061_DURZI|nr:beclin-1-like protein isoform X2 [Durio zibethinus]